MSDATPSVRRRTYSVDEAAKILGLSRNSAYVAVKRGEIPSVKIGGRYVIPCDQLDRLLGTSL